MARGATPTTVLLGSGQAAGSITLAGVVVRTLACFALVFAVWNPTGHSYLAWLWHGDGTAAAKAAAGSVLLALLLLFLRITWLSLGALGLALGLALLASGV